MKENHTITIDEGQRQAILLAIAHLGITRPGWDYMLTQIALQMDNKRPDGEPQMFREFQSIEKRARAPIAYTAGWIKRLSFQSQFSDDDKRHLIYASQVLANLAGVTIQENEQPEQPR